MQLRHFISVTFSEFQVWYKTGELRCNISRFVPFSVDETGKIPCDPLRFKELVELLPYVDLEEEHSVMIVQLMLRDGLGALNACARSDNPALLHMVYVPSKCIQALYPLTHRGARLLATRLEGLQVKLSEPVFEESFTNQCHEWLYRGLLRGADSLLKLAIANSSFNPSESLVEESIKAVHLANDQRQCPIKDRGMVANVLCYNRHKPIPDSDIGYIMDLGVILSERFGEETKVQPLIKYLREYCKNADKTILIADILSFLDKDQTFRELTGLLGLPVNILSLVQFIRWKYLAQRADSVPIHTILESIRQCAGAIPKICIEEAVWIFGLFCGFEKFALDIYLRNPQDYLFLSAHISHKPIEVPDLVRSMPKQEPAGKSGPPIEPPVPKISNEPTTEVGKATEPEKGKAKGKRRKSTVTKTKLKPLSKTKSGKQKQTKSEEQLLNIEPK